MLKVSQQIPPTGAHLNTNTIFPDIYGNSHYKDKTVVRHPIFTIGIPILVRYHFYIEKGPGSLFMNYFHIWNTAMHLCYDVNK